MVSMDAKGLGKGRECTENCPLLPENPSLKWPDPETYCRKDLETLTVYEGGTLEKEETHRPDWNPQLIIFHSQLSLRLFPGAS